MLVSVSLIIWVGGVNVNYFCSVVTFSFTNFLQCSVHCCTLFIILIVINLIGEAVGGKGTKLRSVEEIRILEVHSFKMYI